MPTLRLLFFGTPELAVPTLERLIAGPHEVVGVVSQPDRARGRGRKESPSPVSAIALREGIALLRPERVGEASVVEALQALRPDLGIVVAFGQFLPKKVRTLPSCGYLINAHASLLPKYRGASPIAQAILDGERETGISVMRVEREMDAGPVALTMRTPIGGQENTAELSSRLAEIAATAIAESVDRIARGEIEWTSQDESRASLAPKLEKSDALLDLRQSARALVSRIHALSPKPGGTLHVVGDGEGDGEGEGDDCSKAVILKVSRARALPFETAAAPKPGGIERDADGVALRIATGDGWLIPLTVQRAGGKSLPTADFLRGFELAADARCLVPDPAEAAKP